LSADLPLEAVSIFKLAASERRSEPAFADAIKRHSMPLCVRRPYGRVVRRRDLTERLDDMEVMMKQLLALAGSSPREKPVRSGSKYARRLLDRAKYFANLSSNMAGGTSRPVQHVAPSAQGMLVSCRHADDKN